MSIYAYILNVAYMYIYKLDNRSIYVYIVLYTLSINYIYTTHLLCGCLCLCGWRHEWKEIFLRFYFPF